MYRNFESKFDKKKVDNVVLPIISRYSDKLLDSEELTINWDNYNELVAKLDDKYLDIIKILDNKLELKSDSETKEKEKTKTKTLISNHLIKIYCMGVNVNVNIDTDENFKLIKTYFEIIYTKVFNDYSDLDRYENSEYNITNKAIIQIIKINVIKVIQCELINTMIKYVVQLSQTDGESIIKIIKENKKLITSIEIYLYQSMVNKLGLNNPNKTNLSIINLDEQKILIINTLEKIFKINFDEIQQNELKKIIEFNKFICENISLYCYEEIIKILYDGKKISMYYEIFSLIKTKLK